VDDALSRLRRLESGSLRIAASTTAKYLAARLLAGFVKRYPGVEIALHVASRQALLARLAANTDDLYILGNAPQDQEVVIQHIAPNPVVVFAGRNHPLVGERAIPFARLAREPLLMREPGSGTRMMCDVAFTRNGAHPLVLMELGSNEAIKEALLAGLGAAVLCQHALGFESQQLAVLDVAGFPLEMHWHLAYPAGKALSPLAQAFMAFVRTEAARITSPHGASHGAPQSALSNDRHGDGGAPRAQ